jgi:hypothetical protein
MFQDVGDVVGDAVSSVVETVGDVASGVVEAASDAVDYVAENPWIIAAAVAAPFALQSLATAAAGTAASAGTAAAGTAAGTAATTSGMASAFEAMMLADAAALGGGSAASIGAGAASVAEMAAAFEASMLADAAALGGGSTAAAGTALASDSLASTNPAAGLSEAAATMSPEVVAPELASVSPSISEMAAAQEASMLADASVLDGLQLGQFDAALEVLPAQEAVQTGQQVLELQNTQLATADPTQVFGPPTEVDALDEIISTLDTAPITEADLSAFADAELTALQEADALDELIKTLDTSPITEADLASQTVSNAPRVYGPAEPGFDLNGNPINDSFLSGATNLASAYLENPLAAAGTAYGAYSGINLLDKILSGGGNESAASNTSSNVANQTSINEPVKGNPISNVGLRDAYDYSKLSQDAVAREINKQQQVSKYTPMQFRDFLAAPQPQSIIPNYVSLEDIQRAAGKL